MSCPYFKESYFAICVVPNSIHVPSIDEMERLCFRSSYGSCPYITRMEDADNGSKAIAAGGCNKLSAEPLLRSPSAAGRGGDSG